ncbi:TonB-dependent receptor [Mucilaginibacter sp. FT3.2]|uniref:TonB-dependent receptor n=1 Tax=Mucilaginibacter sp. FT3.2 TaxID=2723090 RepID=UPI0016111E73|nr:TonB-dependent receptor [Mucilaginibacter sp. FT3.2]MBB6231654.1 TonB-linked SusC/RagA family outer membrane protein [Mucilaginibacter sp. FT3.2]
MKITSFLLLISVLTVSANSFAQKITLNEKKANLKDVLVKIRQQSGYDIIYSNDMLENAKLVTIRLTDASLEDALKASLENQELTYKIADGTIVIKAKDVLLIDKAKEFFAAIDVHGRVVDEKGMTLPGASVKVKGTTSGTVTDNDGNFKLKVQDEKAILVISFISYESVEINATSGKDMLVRLQPVSGTLNDVVVVGYGTQKKVNLTGSVAVVKGADLENRPVMNATQRLEGLVPGLNVSVGGNTHPGQSYNLNVRGVGNLSRTDVPFVLVDGTPLPLDDINPNDIESISVLKDAAASAIYGARAAYGVILVTTKKGAEGKTKITYSDNIGFTSPAHLPDLVNSYQFAQYFNAATYNATGTKQYSDAKLAQLQQYIQNPAGFPILPEANDNYLSNWENTANGVANTNWLDFNYKPYALRQTHNLNISGGNKAVRYYISGGYNQEGGALRYADINYKRYNFNSTLNADLTSWAKVSLNSKFTQSTYATPFSGNFEALFFHNMLRMRPNISPYDLSGNFNEISSVPYFQSGSKSTTTENVFSISPSLKLQPLKNWTFNIDLNILKTYDQNSSLLLPGTIYGIDGTPKLVNRSEFGIPIGGSYGRTTTSNNYVSPNIYTSYDLKLGSHQITIMGGYQQELNQFSSLGSNAQDLISFATPGISLTTTPSVSNEARNEWATRGYFGRINYNYKNKFLVEVNGRYDGSSRFATGNRWGFFPSMSAGYNLAEENFIKNWSNQINLLKLRGSYGALGNQAGAPIYSYAQTMSTSIPGPSGAGPQWYFQNGREANILAPAPYNPSLTWEKVLSSNLGLDFELFGSHLTGSIDVYQRNTNNMLGPTFDIADMFGGTVPASNNADLRTRGWELSLNWRGNIGKDIKYRIGGILSDYKSVVTKYQNPTLFNPTGSYYVGKTIGEIWGYKADGLIQTQAQADAYNKQDHSYLSPLAWKPGDVNYLDLNHDGKINNGNNKLGDMGDLTVIGNTTPRYAYSFNGSISWKGITFSTLLQGIGKQNYAPGVGDVYFWGAGALAQVTVFKQHLNYWTPENPGAYYPAPYASPAGSQANYANKTQQVSDRYLQSAAYLRVKNVALNYSLPKSLISRLKLSNVDVFVTGENLLTFTKLAKMFDPEGLAGSQGTGKSYPVSKIYAFGLNVSL